MLQRAGPHVMDWGHELQAQILAWEQENQSFATAAPGKRTASSNADLVDRGVKRAKTVDPDDVMSDEAMKIAFDKNEVGKVSSPVHRDRYRRNTLQCKC